MISLMSKYWNKYRSRSCNLTYFCALIFLTVLITWATRKNLHLFFFQKMIQFVHYFEMFMLENFSNGTKSNDQYYLLKIIYKWSSNGKMLDAPFVLFSFCHFLWSHGWIFNMIQELSLESRNLRTQNFRLSAAS